MKPIIRIQDLGKSYVIGAAEAPYATMGEAVARFMRTPFKRVRGGQQASKPILWALRNVSFDVMPGEIVGLIGRNGAGKSTLLKILSRITTPTSGRVDLYGRVGSLLEVGTGFHGELTGRENIYLNGAILGMRRIDIRRRFDEIVEFAEVQQFIDTPVKHYSTGMYLRLAFAVAAHLEPEVLIVDEILAVGDAAFQKKCLGKIGEAARGGRTVLFVSHNMNAIEELCERVVLLDAGRVRSVSADVRKTVCEYLFSGASDLTAARWTNEDGRLANPWFQPLEFSIRAAGGETVVMPARNDAALTIRITGRVERNDPALNFGYAAFNEAGQLLYWSLSTDTAPSKWPTLQPGVHSFEAHVPSRLLNEGTYRLELVVSLHCREWICRPGVNAPSIYLTIQGGLSESPYWMGARPGILAPVFQWTPC